MVGATVLLSAAAALGISLKPASSESLMYLALAALLPQLVGHNLVTWSLRYVKPTVVGIAILGEPVGATILGWWWLGETVSWPIATGCGVTLFAVILAIRRRRSSAETISG